MVHEKCRICLETNKLLINLFDGSDAIRLSSKIMNLTNVQIYHDDGLPNSICIRCNKKLDECIEFINLCKKSDKDLRSKTNNIRDEENSTIFEDNADECKFNPKNDNNDSGLADADGIQEKDKTSKEEYSSNLYAIKRLSQKQQCFTCGKVMSSRFRLQTHLATHLKEKQHSCTYCKKRFTIVENLNAHLRIHTGEKPYRCATCGKTFAQSSGLIVHKRKHTGQMPYQCVLCPRSFQTIGNFKYHVRVHTGERNYDCSTCGRAFITSGDLKQHKATHSGEKPHICSICGIRFSRASNLKRHVSYLHNEEKSEKSFICQHCSLKFLRKIDLTKHELYCQVNKTIL
ncbi:zinc finger protein 383-like isoform X2 [Maniola jurtina]|uniref:zinc finger protein 383-like isoform X2 n=1 Tax=Maniola jurtina TaxID=191418 RepID=UPI001E68B949|nr:zinc finger protein 383-like isoform X2 [Maniola jurtina]